MSKAKFLFRCKNCSALFNKWQGKCEQCSSWDTIEKLDEKLSQNTATSISKADRLTAIADTEEKDIWQTGVYELDRVLGKGFVYQSIGLLGGAPGIGKSTLILQILGRLTKLQKKVLYVSGEESASQIKLRAQRLEVSQENIFIIIENSLENILATVTQLKPDFIVIDSIQTVSTEEASSSAGSQTQVRECTMKILHYSKQNPATFLLVGHITKDGNLAGPKILEHMVDYVLYLEEENNYELKTLKAVKNRFGSTFETGLFKMTAKGLAEISQPNKVLMSNLAEESTCGTAFFPMMQGNRTLLIEIQALVGKHPHPASLKTSVGLDRSKLLLLLAVLDKYLGLNSTAIYSSSAVGLRYFCQTFGCHLKKPSFKGRSKTVEGFFF